ncbi:MAG: hypothetical protein GY870_10800, partial [archaeon]|nr:hypothetical protein [archaeon]
MKNPNEQYSELREEILDKIRPSDEENTQILNIIEETTKIIKDWNTTHDKLPYELIIPQGSTGIKKTNLKGAADIDLFIFLDPNKYEAKEKPKRARLAELFSGFCNKWIIPALKSAGYKDVIFSYAEHPYVSAYVERSFGKFDIDIVFAFLLSEEYILNKGPITAVDRTYSHSNFIKEHLSEQQRDDVRILKKFFKSHFSYGDKAPIARGGFIGYSAELLIYHFGDIWNLFKNFDKLPSLSIDYFKRDEKELRKLERLQNDLLLIMDPTDKKRNVAASISPRAWIYCNFIVQKFLKNPNPDFILNSIIPKNIEIEVERKKNDFDEHYVVIEVEQNTDEHYTKIRDKLYSLGETLTNIIIRENNGAPRFSDLNYSIYFNPPSKIFSIALYTTKPNIDEKYLRKGPKADGGHHHQNFKEKHEDMFEKEGYCYINQQRKFTNFYELVKDTVKSRIFEEIDLLGVIRATEVKRFESMNALAILKYCI